MEARTILLVADNLPDIERLSAALQQSPVPIHLHVAYNEREALAWLQRIGQETGAPRPDIIVLAGPGSQNSKHEVITALRKDPQLKSIPVVVLTLGPPVAGS